MTNPLRTRRSSGLRLPILVTAMCLIALPGLSQPAAPAAIAVPRLIKYSGALLDGRGYPITTPVEVTFALYSEPASSSSALWQETQHVSPNEKGVFTVYLGAAAALPAEAFTSVAAEYLGVKVDGEAEQPRVLLASVPYALKAGDAETLGGLPASAFMLAGSKSVIAPAIAAPAEVVTPDSGSTVTTTGGSSNYLPLFSGSSTVVNSEIYDSGTGVGIGDKPSSGAKLDVNGSMILRGTMTGARTGNATATQGYPSISMAFFANAYNSKTKTTNNPNFQLKSEPTGNNTSSPSATFNVLFQNGGALNETGLYINPNGTFHFAPGQTFPANVGTITGVTAGTGLSGGGTSGNVTLGIDASIVPELGGSNSFSGSNTFNSYATFNSASNFNEFATLTSAYFGTGSSSNPIPVDSHGELGSGGIGIFGTLGVPDSNTLGTLYSEDGYSAGVWADTPNGGVAGLIATADNTVAGLFENNSSTYAPIDIVNAYPGGPNSAAPILRAEGPGGVCGIDQSGTLACTGQIKTLAATQGGTRHVETYSVQSAENWLEDYGSGTLHGGSATIALDPAFAETVNTGVEFHVFLTPGGDCKGLYVSNKSSTGFEVHELGGGTAGIAFDYKIVAKRRGHESERLVDVTERMRVEAEAAHPKSTGKGGHYRRLGKTSATP